MVSSTCTGTDDACQPTAGEIATRYQAAGQCGQGTPSDIDICGQGTNWAGDQSVCILPMSLDVNFNDADLDYTTFKSFGSFGHNPNGGIAGDGALDFGTYSAINWKQALTGGVGTTITQSLVFTNNNLEPYFLARTLMVMGFTNNVESHVANPTVGGGGTATSDAFQLQLFNSLTIAGEPTEYISTTLRSFIDGSNGEQKYANFAYTGTNNLRFDLTLTRTGTMTFDWGFVVTDLGTDGAGTTEVGSDTLSVTSADFAASLDGGGIYAGLRSGDQAGGLVSGLDHWSVNIN